MKRIIKFRAWDKNKECFCTPNNIGEYIWSFNGECDIEILSWDGNDYTPIDMVLQQYTGLKDKNGKEIYEGDIILAFNTKPKPEYTKDAIKKQVVFKQGRFVFEQHDKDYLTRTLASCECEIIGNIFENTELIYL